MVLLEINIRRVISLPVSYMINTLSATIDKKNTLILKEDGIFSHSSDFINEIDELDNLIKTGDSLKIKGKATLFDDVVRPYFTWSYLASFSNYNFYNYIPQELGEIKSDAEFSTRNKTFEIFKSRLIQNIITNADSTYEKTIKSYIDNRINAEGFRSIPFKFISSRQKKILLLGDSFTYGFSSMPFHNSFADLLLLENYIVYNTGIPGTNVINYYAIAAKYIPLLKPDVVITFFYSDNDMINFNWESNKHRFKPFYILDMGLIPSIINGEYYEDKQAWIQAAQDCIKKKMKLQFLSNSLLYHLLYNKFNENKINECFPDKKDENPLLTNKYLLKIDSLSSINSAEHIVIVIPEKDLDVNGFKKEYKTSLFNDLEVYFPDIFRQTDYRTRIKDSHFNNTGHEKMRDYVLHILNNY